MRRIIKKYNNRRLYDTTDSKYITIAEIGKLIREDVKIQVIDQDNKDITSQVLIQVIQEYEQAGYSMLPEEFLLMVIKFYDEKYVEKAKAFWNNFRLFKFW